ncbi:ABC-2 type transport system permease protein [Chitinophaga terrae (ex Kim and Jung 2007)]|uniref:ABC transporter permease n=1 Tax=Chitinophaga terrae (ex Kim and Jung 2007) TaxID=408074 RepID=UPI0027889B42|nr:ABC transporter permease [Chitinophaga terrae (ex Kim and Jung 2007)]MDQ0106240.1 ABC-2 type transport system permease protein [Chitinophaga terrae (ex Kim and Jung 2007)]
MKQFLVFIRKEFFHVFRDRRTLLIMFGLPLVQIVLFGYALTSEVKNITLTVIDNSRDENSRQLVNKIRSSSYFVVDESSIDYNDVLAAFRKGSAKCALIFPAGFGNDLLHQGKAQIQILTDGSDPNTAKTVVNYISSITTAYQQEISRQRPLKYLIIPEPRMLYNEEGNGSLNFIPGVMALVLMIVCTALTSVSVVREKETGTMEILLVSPFKPLLVLIAKAVPYLILSLLNIIMILLLAVFVLNVTIKGSIILLFLESMLFIITCLSFGLMISNTTNSQQTALLLSMMGLMIPTMIFTGFMFPLENMPKIFQLISNLVPSRWYFLIIKAVMLKGLGFKYIWKETLVLLAMTLILLTIALKKFKTRLS